MFVYLIEFFTFFENEAPSPETGSFTLRFGGKPNGEQGQYDLDEWQG